MADQMKFHVTREQVEAARNKLAEAGFPITGESGAIEKDGYRIGYALSNEILSLQVLAKPRFVPLIAVESRVRSLLAAEGIEWMQDRPPPSLKPEPCLGTERLPHVAGFQGGHCQ